MIERAQRFRRRMNGKDRAVSPVVATLILILIAVAAAAALYLWLVTWQGNITGGIGNQHVQSTLHIGGSTSVYPFDELATTWFMQNNSDIGVTNSQGGSGAGMIAVCAGDVNLGAASFPVDAAVLVSSYGCSPSVESTIQVTTVAYDAVDVIVSNNNVHGLLSINYDTLALIYADATVEQNAHPSLVPTTVDGAAIPTGVPTPSTIVYGTTGGYLEWAELPAAVSGATIGTYTETQTGITVGASTAACTGFPEDVCPTAGATPCGWEVCASGTQTIDTWARSDASGTTQSFEARLLNAENSHSFATAAQLQAPTTGFSGCGSSNYISDCGYVATGTGAGNPAVIAGVAGDVNGIGYASDGLARASGSGVNNGLVPFLGAGQSQQSSNYGGIVPTTGGSGTIALGIKSSQAGAPSTDYTNGYLGWRPFDLVSLQAPSGTAAAFLTFVTDPANNQALATQAQEVSIYSV